MMLAVHGPNLRDQSNGAANVHVLGCRDSENRRKYPEPGWPLEAFTRLQVVADVYPPTDFMYDLGDPVAREPYADDVWFAPCTKALPLEEA